MKRLSALVFTILITLSGCDTSHEVPYTFADGVDKNSEAIKSAIKAFEAACPAVVKGVNNIDELVISPGQSVFHTPDYGWNRGVNIKFHIVANPVGDDGFRGVANHNCWADIGGGFKPGVDVYKPTCAALCSGSQMDRYFLPDATLSIIETVEEAKLSENIRINDGEQRKKEILKSALSGNYQAQRNAAYGYATGDGGSIYDPIKACGWYMIVIVSKHKQVDSTDVNNYKLFCERNLTKTDYDKAVDFAEALRTEMGVAKK